jgi:hypothetical protein
MTNPDAREGQAGCLAAISVAQRVALNVTPFYLIIATLPMDLCGVACCGVKGGTS